MMTKTKILETAIKLFVKQGIEHTPTSQISKEADVATGTLFHHFETKDELINRAYIYVIKKSMEDLKSSKETILENYLRQIWFSGMEWSIQNQEYVQFMINFANSEYITSTTMDKAEDILRPYFHLMADGFKHPQIKPLPQPLLINIYNRIFELFFNFSCDIGYDEETIEQGFLVVWDALTR